MLAAGAAAGLLTGAVEAAGAAAGAEVFDFAGVAAVDFTGVAAGVAAAAVVVAVAGAAAEVVDFFVRLFLGAAASALAEAAGAVADLSVAAFEAADFFEADFLGVVELPAVAVLSAASAFFDVLFFLVDAVFESGAACEAEASEVAFFFLAAFFAALASLWL